jgi:Ca-activated chloride channel family protein
MSSPNTPRTPAAPERDKTRLGFVLLAAGSLGVLALVSHSLSEGSRVESEIHDEIPDRFTEVTLAPGRNPDAGEGAKAKREEGRVGDKDAKMASASGNQAQLDKETAENAGVLGALREDQFASEGVFSAKGMSTEISGGVGGLLGAKGVQLGDGGLGTRGSGLGGGGTAEGLGGLGSKGRGSGGSGYGAGGASFGASGSGGVGVVGGSPVILGANPRSGQFPVSTPRDVSSSGEGYADYGVNRMTIAGIDRHSTFGLDVDTASYSIARSKLNMGQLPPAEAVRVEEFVNAIDYDYAAPDNLKVPFAVHMEAAPNPFVPNHHVLRVGIQGAEPPASDKPARLTFLVDVSGSMNSPDKLGLAQSSLKKLVSELGPEDSVALVTYAGSTGVVLEPTPCTRKEAIYAAIDGLRSGGGTAMGSGMTLAYQVASSAYVEGAENRVIVLSDGDANIGRTTPEQILSTIRGYADEGITMSTIGFGMGNYQDTMMEQLANKGDGNYFYVDSAEESEELFGERLTSMVHTIAKDTKLQVEFNPEVVYAYRLIGYENRDIADKDFRNDQVDAGEVGRGHQVTALYDVVLMESAPTEELATVRIRAKRPGPDSPAHEWTTVFGADELELELSDTSRSFRMAFAVASFAELLRESPYAQEFSYADVFQLARTASRRSDEEDQELLGLIVQAAGLSGEPIQGT